MKRLFLTWIWILLIVTLVVSCSSGSTAVGKRNDVDVQNVYDSNIIQEPLVAKLEVAKTRVTGRADGKSIDLIAVKEQAVNNALKQAQADVLVEPKFEITTQRNSNISVSVVGFPAMYTNFRSITEADTLWLNYPEAYSKDYRLSVQKMSNTPPPPPRRSKVFWLF